MNRFVVVLALVGGAMWPSACATRAADETHERPPPPPAPAVVWASSVAAAHAFAAAQIQRGELSEARSALVHVLELRAPSAVAPDDVAWVRQDLFARLAGLELRAGEPQRALDLANQGLALGVSDTVPVLALWSARGRAERALGRSAESDVSFANTKRIRMALGSKE